MLVHLTLQDFVIVTRLELDFGPGFSALTGETGAGKSILIDALQLALGARADSSVVREGAARAEIAASFDSPASLGAWLEIHGFAAEELLILRRVVDAHGKSRAFINGSPATATQLREAAEHLMDIHGQHAWQGLTRPASVRALLDVQAGVDTRALAAAYADCRLAAQALEQAQTQQGALETERERLQWQLGELTRLSPGTDEWPALNAEHQRLAHGQALLDAAQRAAQWVSDDETSASGLLSQAAGALDDVAGYDERLPPLVEQLRDAQAQLDDVAHSLHAYLSRAELDPARLAELDERLSVWMGMARRWRRPADELPALLAECQSQLAALERAADLPALERRVAQAEKVWKAEADRVSAARRAGAGPLGQRVTDAMQQLGMAGGRFEVAFSPLAGPQPHGQEAIEFLVAGHAGVAARPLAKVASGGELSRLALAIAVTTAQARGAGSADQPSPSTLIFDEIDSGVGGSVADAVGRLMRRLGRSTQVLAVTHLPQVAACADEHWVVAKRTEGGQTSSQVAPVRDQARVAEVARMLGGQASDTSLAHARALIERAQADDAPLVSEPARARP